MTKIHLHFVTFFILSVAMNFKKVPYPVKFLITFGQKQKIKMSFY